MYLDIYAIQTVPPSNINRDDTGAPKTCVYGGKLRARVSSQAWKRAMRQEFARLLPEGSLGVRTKLAVDLVADKICELAPEKADDAQKLAEKTLKFTGLKTKEAKRSGQAEGAVSTEYLVFIARSEIESLARVAIEPDNGDIEDADAKKRAKAAFHGTGAVDVALFGRMLADAPDLNVDAAAQVAHAISVDEVEVDYDYFTALDDCAPKDNAGAEMIDTVAFDSSTLYRYATVNLDSLSNQLGDAEATACGARAFAEAFVRSMPTGKQNTFANRTLPSTVYVALREGQPVNAVSAFEVPVRPTACSPVSHEAAERLGEKLTQIDEAFGTAPLKAWSVVVGEPITSLAEIWEPVTLGELMDSLQETVGARLTVGE